MWEEQITCGRAGWEISPAEGHALPGDRARWPRDRVVDVRKIHLNVTLDVPAKTVRGTVTHTVRAMGDGLAAIAFDAAEMTVSGVTIGGAAARYSYDGVTVRVTPEPPPARGEDLEVAIDYEARPRIGLYFIGPDEGYPEKPHQVWSQGQDEDSRYWFPCIDYVGQKQAFELVATVRSDWSVLSNGKLLEDRENGDGTRTFHWSQELPLATYLITLVAGQFARIDGSTNGLTIDYLVEEQDLADGQRTFGNTPAMIALFERITGVPYPWEKYSQIVVRDFVFGGMENTSATTMTRNIIVDAKAAVDFTSDDLVSHELAHMWWGDLLTCKHWSHGWLNEGFATYFEMLWDEEHRGIDEYRQGVVANMTMYLEESYQRPIVSNVFHEPIDLFDRHLYEKGSLVLHALRGVLGDDAFFRSIQRYCRENQHRSVLTQDLVDAIEAESGRNLEWFFDQWVFRPGHPELKVSWSWDDAQRLATVTVKQTQKTENGAAIFRIPVTVDFTVGRGKRQAFRVEVTEAEHSFVFPLAARPDMCRFDPYNQVPKELTFEKSVGELRLQLRDDDDIAGRQFAAEQLGKKGGHEAVAALAEALHRDRFWAVQAAAAKALGATRSNEAREALVLAAKIRNAKARRAVIAALGQFRGDEAVFPAVRAAAAKDRSWFVEGEAHRSAGKLRAEGSFDLLVAGMERDSFRQVIRQGCIDGFVELRDERAFEILIEAARYGAPQQSRAAAVGAIGRLGVFFEGRKKALADEVTPLLDDPDFRVRISAARALRGLGEASAAAALDQMAVRELDGRGVRAAREASMTLRKGASTDSEVKALRDDFEKARDENARLRERLEKLEAVRK